MKKLSMVVAGVLVAVFVIGWGILPKQPKVVTILEGQGKARYGKVNLFEGLSEALYQCSPDRLRFLKLKGDVHPSYIHPINSFCDAVLIDDWRLLETLKKRGVRVPIFIHDGALPQIKTVVYAVENELFDQSLFTRSKHLFDKCVGVWGEQIIGNERERIFTRIYREGVWGRNAAGEGFSGFGSLPENARPWIAFLEEFLEEHNIQSVLEIGCGDWTLQQYINWGDVDYTGVDFVEYILNRNEEAFGSDKIRFIHMDAIEEELPQADLVICKELFQHLSNRDTQQLLKKCRGFNHCLFVDDYASDGRSKRDTPTGGYLPTSLLDAPFGLEGKRVLDYQSLGSNKIVIHSQGI